MRGRDLMSTKQAAELIQDNLKKLLVKLRKIELKSVMIGVPADHTERSEGDPITNASIGYIMEHGSPANNIPARPHLAPGVREATPKFTKYMVQAGQAALKGENPDRFLNMAGMVAASSVKNKINSNVGPALKEGTLAARRRRGHKSTKTLVETAQYRNAITYVLRDTKKGK